MNLSHRRYQPDDYWRIRSFLRGVVYTAMGFTDYDLSERWIKAL